MRLDYFSYSRLSSFKQCPARFKIHYIDGVHKEDESIEAFLGKCVHEVLEYLYTKRKDENTVPLLDELLDVFHSLWKEKWHANIAVVRRELTWQYYLALGEKCIAWYYRCYHPFNEPVIGIEYPFEIDIGEGLRFKGIIDRVDITGDGVITVHDYKTGKRALSQRQADRDLQLSIYQLAIEKEFSTQGNVSLVWHFLQTGKRIESRRTEMQQMKHKQDIIKQAKAIISHVQNGQTFAAKPCILCNWCYYWKECPIKYSDNPYRGKYNS